MRLPFLKNIAGNVAITFGLALAPIAGLSAGAVDFNRFQSNKSSLQNSLDAAALATVADGVEDGKQAGYAKTYMESNFKQLSQFEAVTVKAIQTDLGVRFTAEGDLKTTMLPIVGIDKLTVSVKSTVAAAEEAGRTRPLEFVMILDTTNSMKFDNGASMATAKTIVSSTFQTLGDSATDEYPVTMSLIPVADRVNIGTSRTKWLTGTAPKNWNGCVEPRFSTKKKGFKALPGGDDGDVEDRDFGKSNYQTAHKPKGNKRFTASEIGKTGGLSNRGGGYPHCPTPIVGPTRETSEVVDAVDPAKGGGTGRFDESLAWGRRLLSPKWKNQWGVKQYPAKASETDKVLTLVTDGKTTAYTWEAGGAFGKRQGEGWNEVTDTGFDLLNETCKSIKSDGITLNIVLINTYQRAINALRSCATSDEHFFAITTAEEFTLAMQDIASIHSTLRLIE